MADDDDHKTRLALIEAKVVTMWKGFWGLITLGAIWIANNLLGLIKVGGIQ